MSWCVHNQKETMNGHKKYGDELKDQIATDEIKRQKSIVELVS